ncbi:hypothetical protein M1N80_04100 [Peptococcaceae bacterium]|nr:hypothetical protein [Peptococcaceae bacterium]
MLLAKNRVGFKVLAVVVALALVIPMVMMPVGAAHAQERGKETNIGVTVPSLLPQEVIDVINTEGAEIKIRENGTPAIVVEVEKKEDEEEIYYIPFTLPSTAEVKNIADGSKTAVEIDGNYLLIPVVEDGEVEIERVCISEFDVIKAIKNDNGQLTLQLQGSATVTVLITLVTGLVVTVMGYYVIDHVIETGRISCGEDVPIYGRGGTTVSYDFRIDPPEGPFDKFRVGVVAYDVDRRLNETINVYFESYDGQHRIHFGTLRQGRDGEMLATLLNAPRGTLGDIHRVIFDEPPIGSTGKFRIVFERENRGWAELRMVRVTYSW